jgi:ribosomal protein S18 acetylase RimI-like enzyme
MHMRSYTDNDLPHLQQTLAGWIAEAGDCGYYHPGNITHRIYEGFGDGTVCQDLVHLWEEDGAIIGLTYSFVFEAGFFAFVAPRYRGTAVELELLQHAMTTTQRMMVKTKQETQTVITDVYDCDQIRIDLLTQLGFAHYRTWDWITFRPLGDPIPGPLLPTGFTIRSATLADAEQLAAIRNNTFGGTWTGEVYREQVMHSPGYQPEREILAVAPDGRVAAFTVIHFDERNKVGLFEPVGTHSDFRRLGLARAVMLQGLRIMQRHGMTVASVEHTAENAAARELYRRLGFVKKYETLGFEMR